MRLHRYPHWRRLGPVPRVHQRRFGSIRYNFFRLGTILVEKCRRSWITKLEKENTSERKPPTAAIDSFGGRVESFTRKSTKVQMEISKWPLILNTVSTIEIPDVDHWPRMQTFQHNGPTATFIKQSASGPRRKGMRICLRLVFSSNSSRSTYCLGLGNKEITWPTCTDQPWVSCCGRVHPTAAFSDWWALLWWPFSICFWSASTYLPSGPWS